MKSFASDNNSGVHPLVMEAILKANTGHAIGYGDDEWTSRAEVSFRKIFGEDIQPFFAFNGTGSNMLALQASTQPFHCILTAETGHIYVDECGAPSKFTACMVKGIPTPDGKLTPGMIGHYLHGIGDQHHPQPKVIYLSQCTELGTVYTISELKEICDFAHQHNLYVHMDGARLSNAAAYLGAGLKELTRDCGIDILSFGGTKNGMMIGEAVIPFRPELAEYMKYYRKQSAQLYSKMRYISAQFSAYLENDLWLKNASHSNSMAQLLAGEMDNLPEVQFTQKVESNALFLTIPSKVIHELQKSYFFYFWNEEKNEIRLVCSWDTTEEDVRDFIKTLKALL